MLTRVALDAAAPGEANKLITIRMTSVMTILAPKILYMKPSSLLRSEHGLG